MIIDSEMLRSGIYMSEHSVTIGYNHSASKFTLLGAKQVHTCTHTCKVIVLATEGACYTIFMVWYIFGTLINPRRS